MAADNAAGFQAKNDAVRIPGKLHPTQKIHLKGMSSGPIVGEVKKRESVLYDRKRKRKGIII